MSDENDDLKAIQNDLKELTKMVREYLKSFSEDEINKTIASMPEHVRQLVLKYRDEE